MDKKPNVQMCWKARLKKPINLVSRSFSTDSVVTLTRNTRGQTHILGFRSAVISDKDWELVWDDRALDRLLKQNGEDYEYF